MFSMLAILIYLAAMAIPACLLYRFGSGTWYWHALAVVGALGLGVMPTPPALSPLPCQLVVGFVFTFLMIWGIGGLFAIRPHREKHA